MTQETIQNLTYEELSNLYNDVSEDGHNRELEDMLGKELDRRDTIYDTMWDERGREGMAEWFETAEEWELTYYTMSKLDCEDFEGTEAYERWCEEAERENELNAPTTLYDYERRPSRSSW